MRTIAIAATLLSATILVMAFDLVPAPEKGKPWPGNKQNLPYEDVMDTSDLIITGTVKAREDGKVKLADVKVLRGKYDKTEAEIIHASLFLESEVDKEKSATFLCLVQEDGTLRLAGDPPKGGGLVIPGPALVACLIEAAKDPAKGYESTNTAVKLSSAYRLARAWVAAPEDKKPKLPADIMDTLLEGLTSDPLRDRNVNSAARNAINLLLDADINKQFKYSVNAPEFTRDDKASDVKIGWRETVKAVQAQRKAKAEGKPEPTSRCDFDTKRAACFVPEEPAKP